MELVKNKKIYKCTIGDKERTILRLDAGNLMITYLDNIYILKRKDGKCFDGTEHISVVTYGNAKKPETIEEILECLVEKFTSLQSLDIDKLFTEFDYKINEENNQIIIYPLYLKEETCAIKVNTKQDEKIHNLTLSFGTRIRCRNKIS